MQPEGADCNKGVRGLIWEGFGMVCVYFDVPPKWGKGTPFYRLGEGLGQLLAPSAWEASAWEASAWEPSRSI